MVTPEEMEKFEEFLQRYMDNANAGNPTTPAAQQEIISRNDEERGIDSASLPPLSNPPIKEMGFVSPHSTMPGMVHALSAQPTAAQRADIRTLNDEESGDEMGAVDPYPDGPWRQMFPDADIEYTYPSADDQAVEPYEAPQNNVDFSEIFRKWFGKGS